MSRSVLAEAVRACPADATVRASFAEWLADNAQTPEEQAAADLAQLYVWAAPDAACRSRRRKAARELAAAAFRPVARGGQRPTTHHLPGEDGVAIHLCDGLPATAWTTAEGWAACGDRVLDAWPVRSVRLFTGVRVKRDDDGFVRLDLPGCGREPAGEYTPVPPGKGMNNSFGRSPDDQVARWLFGRRWPRVRSACVDAPRSSLEAALRSPGLNRNGDDYLRVPDDVTFPRLFLNTWPAAVDRDGGDPEGRVFNGVRYVGTDPGAGDSLFSRWLHLDEAPPPVWSIMSGLTVSAEEPEMD